MKKVEVKKSATRKECDARRVQQEQATTGEVCNKEKQATTHLTFTCSNSVKKT